MLLAPGLHGVQDGLLDLLDIPAGSGLDLREGGGVYIQGLDIDQNLVVVNLHGVVDALCRLRQCADGLDDAMCAEFAALLHEWFPP